MSQQLDESKRNRRTAKRILAIGLPLVLIAGAGIGYAYWTTAGSGSGTAATSATAPTVTITQTSTISGLAPGVGASTITVLVTNNGTIGAHVNVVTASIASVTKAGNPVAGCGTSDYSLAGAQMAVPALSQDIAPGGTLSVTGATIAFNNKATVQDACEGATVNLSYLVS